jgi:hypothetical protein
VVAAAASVLMLPAMLVLGFRFERDVPAGPGDARLEAAVRTELDRQWQLSGLQGIVVRPDYVPAPIVTDRQWNGLMLDCMDRAGVGQWGYDEGSGLFVEGARPSASDQLAFYWCFAAYPRVELLSAEQLDFVYDYYQRWLIPCLEVRGYNVMNAPTRKAFVEADPDLDQWGPYGALERYPATFGGLERLAEQCERTVPGIAGWSEQ